MPKSTDVPNELRRFNDIFERIARRWDYSTVFNDYLTYCIEVFNANKTGQPIEKMKSTYGEQYNLFVELFHEHMHVMNKMCCDESSWYDLLGTFYECINSRSKASRTGQFFTPQSICDMTSIMTISKESKGKGQRINDPTCGSGRMLIAAHVIAPGNYLYGDDIDPMCAKMCAINMVIHGCVGQVNCIDSLCPDKWYFAYEINPQLYSNGLISLRPIEKEESFTWTMFENMKKNFEKTKKEKPQPQQLSLL